MTRSELDKFHLDREKIFAKIRKLQKDADAITNLIAEFCDHRNARDMEKDCDNGYGRWWKHQYKFCPDCRREQHYGSWR